MELFNQGLIDVDYDLTIDIENTTSTNSRNDYRGALLNPDVRWCWWDV
ncbi:MAG: hypothetical protein U5O39_11755 [Gammaproteobacteria bacterium]|nr:hypothetical protein [Gammaproteobacteria bacterium]